MIGFTTGKLTVISRSTRKAAYPYWVCQCECGGTTEVAGHNLRRKKGNESCGCSTAEARSKSLQGKNTTHGLTQGGVTPPEYGVWRGMLRRCEEPDHHAYSRYGGRGIKVCKRWHDFGNFYADMGPKPPGRQTIERLNNSRGYSPSNCVWADWIKQANNKSSNVFLAYRGRKQTIAQWAREVGIHRATLGRRIRKLGWSVEDALTTPVRQMSR